MSSFHKVKRKKSWIIKLTLVYTIFFEFFMQHLFPQHTPDLLDDLYIPQFNNSFMDFIYFSFHDIKYYLRI